MELFRRHVLREERYRAVIVIAPVAAEDPAFGVHLRIEAGTRQWGKDQCEGGLQAVCHGEFGDLIEDRGCVLIKADDERTHDADLTLMKTADRIGVVGRFIRKLVHGINRVLRERFETDIDAHAA